MGHGLGGFGLDDDVSDFDQPPFSIEFLKLINPKRDGSSLLTLTKADFGNSRLSHFHFEDYFASSLPVLVWSNALNLFSVVFGQIADN